MKVFVASLKERFLHEHAVAAMESVMMRAGACGYGKLDLNYMRTDSSRNLYCKKFIEVSQSPDDVLVMLDYDHVHPVDIVDRLVAHQQPVVGALAFRRGIPYYPCVFFRDRDGVLKYPKRWEPRLYRCTAVGTGAIAIQRRTFDLLHEHGFDYPWFCYTYPPGEVHPSEDMYFCRLAEVAGIPLYCDFATETPHITSGYVVAASWDQWLQENPSVDENKLIERPLEYGKEL